MVYLFPAVSCRSSFFALILSYFSHSISPTHSVPFFSPACTIPLRVTRQQQKLKSNEEQKQMNKPPPKQKKSMTWQIVFLCESCNVVCPVIFPLLISWCCSFFLRALLHFKIYYVVHIKLLKKTYARKNEQKVSIRKWTEQLRESKEKKYVQACCNRHTMSSNRTQQVWQNTVSAVIGGGSSADGA